MPRNAESFESQVLTYFRTASTEKVEMLFGFIRPIVKERTAGTPKKVSNRKPKADKPSPDTAAASALAERAGV